MYTLSKLDENVNIIPHSLLAIPHTLVDITIDTDAIITPKFRYIKSPGDIKRLILPIKELI